MSTYRHVDTIQRHSDAAFQLERSAKLEHPLSHLCLLRAEIYVLVVQQHSVIHVCFWAISVERAFKMWSPAAG